VRTTCEQVEVHRISRHTCEDVYIYVVSAFTLSGYNITACDTDTEKTAAETLSRGLTNNTLNLSERHQVGFAYSIIASTANGYPFTYFWEFPHPFYYSRKSANSTERIIVF